MVAQDRQVHGDQPGQLEDKDYLVRLAKRVKLGQLVPLGLTVLKVEQGPWDQQDQQDLQAPQAAKARWVDQEK